MMRGILSFWADRQDMSIPPRKSQKWIPFLWWGAMQWPSLQRYWKFPDCFRESTQTSRKQCKTCSSLHLVDLNPLGSCWWQGEEVVESPYWWRLLLSEIPTKHYNLVIPPWFIWLNVSFGYDAATYRDWNCMQSIVLPTHVFPLEKHHCHPLFRTICKIWMLLRTFNLFPGIQTWMTVSPTI